MTLNVIPCPPVDSPIPVAPAPQPPSVDLAALKQRQQTIWASGDFAVVGTTLQWVGEELCEAIDLNSGERVLDVACGNGNATLAAARRWARVTGIDYVPELLRRGAERAAAERLDIDFRSGDAEQLEFADHSFDVVLSTYGVMFAPDQVQAARELLRVCRPGGRIGLANWTPEGFIGKLLQVVGRYVPPPAGVASPLRWGTESGLDLLLGAGRQRRVERKLFNFRYLSDSHFIEIFRNFYGPTHRAFSVLDAAAQFALNEDLRRLIEQFSRPSRGGLVVPAEYMQVVIEV